MRLGLFALVLLGCSRDATPSPPVRSPIPYLADAPFGPDEAGCLVAFLPGAGDDARSYVEHGFVEQLREANVKVDAWSVDATLEYYRGREIETRVREDVLLPATELGYRRIWLVGISMGGGGALRVAATSEELVHGVVVLAPFLGSPFLARDVRAAGGPAVWQPSAELLAQDDPYVDAWRWVGRRGDTPLVVGWGEDDTIAMMSEALATGLPPSHVLHAAGDHEWVVWEQLWRAFVASGFLQRACGVVASETETRTASETGTAPASLPAATETTSVTW
ncbi:MAG: alpha/beta hydrolase-fold protein [Myxococcota bacterium]|jgi:pimeloyl-ACP methyl ester carboxylesterase|nr:alpha/beta hydrolase-fold protein [Myxococcota bacterium]